MQQAFSIAAPADAGVEDPGHTPTDVAAPTPAPKRQASETRRLYASDWASFAAWGRARQLSVLPASSATVAAYLQSLGATLGYGALARRVAAIADRHRQNTLALPTPDATVRAVLRAARAARLSDLQTSKPGRKTAPARRPLPPGSAQLQRMAVRCPSDLAGLRDRALLLLSAAGFAGERLLALDREHVRFTAHGMTLAVPGAPADRGTMAEPAPAPLLAAAGQAATPAVAPALLETSPDANEAGFVTARLTAAAACPVRALERWLEHSETRFGPVFRKVNRWGGIEHTRLRRDALRHIWQRRGAVLRETAARRRTDTTT